MKSYTDLEQSKVLSEILPLESSDMCYLYLGTEDKKYQDIPICAPAMEGDLCAWSLAALLDIIPEGQVNRMMSNGNWMALSWPPGHYYIAKDYDSAVDACYALILRLHEQNIL